MRLRQRHKRRMGWKTLADAPATVTCDDDVLLLVIETRERLYQLELDDRGQRWLHAVLARQLSAPLREIPSSGKESLR